MHDILNSTSLTNNKSRKKNKKALVVGFVYDTDEINQFELQSRILCAVDRFEQLLV